MICEAKFGEPWRTEDGIVYDHDENEVGGVDVLKHGERLTACVNACQGIANPQAVKAVIEAAREYQQIMRADQSCGNGRPDFLRLIGLLHKTDKALAALEGK